MGSSLEVGPVHHGHRQRVHDILAGAGIFRTDEIEVALELFDETFSKTNDGPVRANRDEARSGDGSYRFLGAVQRDPSKRTEELAGFVCWGPTPGTDRTWDLYWIAVDPAVHGRGAGSMLMAEVERRIQKESARLLVVETSSREDYEPTRRFYLGRGYEEAARLGSFYAPDDERVVYVKRFSQEPSRGGAAA